MFSGAYPIYGGAAIKTACCKLSLLAVAATVAAEAGSSRRGPTSD